MELLDRYLKAVRSYLPDGQKDDIVNELSENIRSQLEDQESELGRPLADSDVEAILKQHGHPLLVAGRYRQDHRSLAFGPQLIGPVLFPFYAKVLAFNLGITCAVIVVVFAALVASGQALTFSGIVAVFFYQLLLQFAIVTFIFALMDKHLAKFPDRWDPRNPKHLQPQLNFAKNSPWIPRMESISQVVALSVALVWLRALQHSPFLILGPAAAFLRLAPVWHQLYPAAAVLLLAGMAQAVINLVRPDWTRLRSVARVFFSLATLAMWGLLLKAGTWIVPAQATGDYTRVAQIANQCFFYGLLIAVGISAFQLFRDLRRLNTRAPDSRTPVSLA
jgi:hypothetical protein